MEKRSIVWGACWFNESIDTLIAFFEKTIKVLNLMGYKVYPVIFDAKLEHNQIEKQHILEKLEGAYIIENNINIYPNKNYGVAAISEFAHTVKSNFIAIVDPDWNVKEYYSFISNLLTPLEKGEAEVVIPNIGAEAGRSNFLVGKPAIALFYPEYSNIIKTAFPGSLIGATEQIHNVTSSNEYHYSWGGEWDIISLSIRNNYKIISLPIDVKNVRHRSNSSKILDAYQIWKAILSNDDIPKRYSNLLQYNRPITPTDELSEILLNTTGLHAIDQIEIINKKANNDTQRQLLYMMLYPIASILQEIDYFPNATQNGNEPYDKSKINYVSELGIYCCRSAIMSSNKTIDEINEISKRLLGNLWSSWNSYSQSIAMNNIIKNLPKGDK